MSPIAGRGLMNPITDPGGLIGPGGRPGEAVTDPGGAVQGNKVDSVLSKLREITGGPYAHWPAPSGYLGWSSSTARSRGLSCSEFLNWGLAQAGIKDHPGIARGTYGFADAVKRNKIDINKTYEPGTIVVATSGPEGHVAMVSGPGNKLIQSDTHAGMNEGKTLKQQQPYANYEFAGSLEHLGTGASSWSDAGSDIGNAIQNLINNLGAGIANGFIMALKYLYGYMILRPWDWWAGFSYELICAVKNDFWQSEEEKEHAKNLAGRNEEPSADAREPNPTGGRRSWGQSFDPNRFGEGGSYVDRGGIPGAGMTGRFGR